MICYLPRNITTNVCVCVSGEGGRGECTLKLNFLAGGTSTFVVMYVLFGGLALHTVLLIILQRILPLCLGEVKFHQTLTIHQTITKLESVYSVWT